MVDDFVKKLDRELEGAGLCNLAVIGNGTEVYINHVSNEKAESSSDRNYKASVIVLTYEPKREKLLFTLNSIISQTYSDYELIITDDGSKEPLFIEALQYLENKGFSNYTYILHHANGGTVKNAYDAVKIACGKYIKLISPGDAFITEHTLKEWVHYLGDSGKSWSFGETVFYGRTEGGKFELLKRECHPQVVDSYVKHDEDSCRMCYVGFFDNVVGASVLCDRKIMIKYLNRIVGKVKYLEDSAYYIMMFDGIMPAYYSEKVILYEDGCGISTSGDQYWLDIISKEWSIVRKIMMENKKDTDRLQTRIIRKINRKYRPGWFGLIVNRRWIFDNGALRLKITKKYNPRMSSTEVPDRAFLERLEGTCFNR